MKRHGILFIIENLPIPLDRRVLLEATSIRNQGVPVFIICPRDAEKKFSSFEILPNQIRVYRYPPPPKTRGYLSYFFEFSYCLLITFLITLWIFLRFGFHAIHTANPPDTFFMLALLFKPFGVKFVYDQHDICPELFMSRFQKKHSEKVLRALYFLEFCSYKTANLVISPNLSYQKIALSRGSVHPRRSIVVRSGPNLKMLTPRPSNPALKQGADYMFFYLGVMGPQDGVAILIEAFAEFLKIHASSRTQFLLTLAGDGDLREDLEKLAQNLNIFDRTHFTGFITGDLLLNYLSSSDIGICPDPPTPFNDKSTMNKILEYMASGLPVICFDLAESRFSAGDAAVYVPGADPSDLAKAMDALIGDPEKMKRLGETGKHRIQDQFGWEKSEEALLTGYRTQGILNRES